VVPVKPTAIKARREGEPPSAKSDTRQGPGAVPARLRNAVRGRPAQEPPLCQPGRLVDITARIERRQVLGG